LQQFLRNNLVATPNSSKLKGATMQKLVSLSLLCLLATSFTAESARAQDIVAIKTNSGLEYTSFREGTGATPRASDTVVVNYRGTLLNGREFDSSYKRGRPAEFQLDQVINCWTEGLQMMKIGGKAELDCPSNIAYGEQGIMGSIPPNASLIFEVELLAIK
jgi:FKBP-type peptidyl-prolyl cis-trans isomerase FkpA